jgi:hypothetical protein
MAGSFIIDCADHAFLLAVDPAARAGRQGHIRQHLQRPEPGVGGIACGNGIAALPACGKDIELNGALPGWIKIAKWHEVADAQAGFLRQFTARRIRRRFAGFEPAAGKTPQAGHGRAVAEDKTNGVTFEHDDAGGKRPVRRRFFHRF